MMTTELNALRKSSSITIRPIRLTDTDIEAKFVRRLSPTTRHFRFLGGVSELSPRMLKTFCNMDGRHSMAFIATSMENGEETEIGVARYGQNTNEEAREMALTVTDDWRHKGVSMVLTEKLVEFAKGHGVKRLYSIDLANNSSMRDLAAELGINAKRDPDDAHQVIYSLSL